jgi:hypothetical protein
MDALHNTFGLTIATGSVGSERAWSDLVNMLGLTDAQGADLEIVASELTAQAPTAAHTFANLYDELTGPADPTAARAADLTKRLGTVGLKALLQGLEVMERKKAIQAAARSLTPESLILVAEAGGQSFSLPLSQPLLELVRKLCRAAETLPDGARVQADQAYRSLIEHLVERWSESQVNAGASSFADLFGETTVTRSSIAPEATRVVALSLETGAIGTVVWASLKEQSRTEKGVRDLISMLSRAPAGRATDMITEQITTPARLSALFREDPIPFESVEMMVNHLGLNATKPLLDELVDAPTRVTRRAIIDRLVKLGPDIGPIVQERLHDNRWYVVRNMITLLRECGCVVDHTLLDRFATHEDARVRREMLQLRMETPALRDSALAAGLADRDKGVLRAALQAARSNMPQSAVPGLAKRVLEDDFPDEFRVMALLLLGKSANIAALDALLAYASAGRSMLGKVKLAPTSPEMLAAFSGLARSWSNERRARLVLDVAEKSKDSQVLNALKSVTGGE